VVDFGIVHKGDTVSARNVSVTNAAPVAAPNDDPRGSSAVPAGRSPHRAVWPAWPRRPPTTAA
jgi:hypothetical protein